MNIIEAIRIIWKRSRGGKTIAGAILLTVFYLFKIIFPNALNDPTKETIDLAIDALILTGVADKLWVNRKVIVEFAKELPTNIQELINRIINKLKKSNHGKSEESS